MTDEQRVKLVDRLVHELGEHFDAVQILVSWPSEEEPGKWADLFRGQGNTYARLGMVQEFLNRDRALTDAVEIGQELKKGNGE